MNIQIYPETAPLKILVINPLFPASQILLMKICNGTVFGPRQGVDIVLLFFDTELLQAEALKVLRQLSSSKEEMLYQLVTALVSVTDADVFCFMSGLKNPNDILAPELKSEDSMNIIYVIAKIAQNFVWPVPPKRPKTIEDLRYKKKDIEVTTPKPIILADGLVAINIIQSLSVGLPHDILFYCSPLTGIARGILARKIQAKDVDAINTVYVWGAIDTVFHVEIEKPMVRQDTHVKDNTRCDWSLMSKDQLKSVAGDHTQFNAAWLKKGFIEEDQLSEYPRLLSNPQLSKVTGMITKHPYGAVSRATCFANTLSTIWRGRYACVHDNVGVISDGCLQTVKGLAYVLPVVFHGTTWKLNDVFSDDSHLKLDIKRINKTAKMHNQKLTNYCNQMLKKAIIVAENELSPEEEWSSTTESSQTTDSTMDSVSDPE